MFVFGIVLALPGTVLGLPDVVARFDLALADRGVLIATMFLGLLAGSFMSGPIVDAIGHRASLAVSAGLIAVCLPLFAVATTYPLALAALAAIGLASAGVNTASNALCSDLFPDERGRRMNGIAIAVGLGGLSMPAATALLAGELSWSAVAIGGALLSGAVAIAAMRVEVPPKALRAASASARIPMVMRQRGLIWFALLVMLGAGTEASMAGFSSTYLTALGFTPEVATWALSAHWVGLIVGRIVFARRVDRAKDMAIRVAAAAGAVTLLLFTTTTSSAVLLAAPFAIGVSIAIIMPTALAFGGERYPDNAGTLFGTLLTVAQAGAMALPAIIGVVAEQAGVRAGMGILVVNNALVAAICLKAARPARERISVTGQ
jgi:MFS transporter, FHS family, glucose/mannose:H+ symporter